jgi:hypothetical protein
MVGPAGGSSRATEVVAAVFPVVFVSVLSFVIPMLFGCRVRQDHVLEEHTAGYQPSGVPHTEGGGEVDGGGENGQHQVDHRMFVRFTCQQGEYNDMVGRCRLTLSNPC